MYSKVTVDEWKELPVPGLLLMLDCLKGLSHRLLGFFWPLWMHLGQNVNHLWFKIFMKLLQFLAAILRSGALHTKPSWRFVESPKKD
jgi:hypothetical protein